jgi:hypothetical protein
MPERPEYYVQTGSMFENPHGVPRHEIVRMLAELPAEVSAQVVFGKYVELSGLVFSGEVIRMAIDRSLPRVRGSRYLHAGAAEHARAAHGPLHGSHLEQGDWGFRYATGVDFGRQTDFTVITTLDCTRLPARVVYWRRLNRVPWEELYVEVGKVRAMFGPSILFDGTGPAGDVIRDALGSRAYCPVHQRTVLSGEYCQAGGKMLGGCSGQVYLPLSCCDSFVFSAGSKRELVEHLRNVLATGYDARRPAQPFGLIRFPPITQLEEEFSFYAWDDRKLTTDCLFSLALAAWQGLEDPVQDAYVGSPMGV